MPAYGLLALAIVAEIVATLSMRISDGFTRVVPTLAVIGGYGLSFFLLSRVLQRGFDVAIVYALWSATGIVLITVIGAVFLNERPTIMQVSGIALVVAGVIAIELGSHGHP